MTEYGLREQYFDWLLGLVHAGQYRNLLLYFHSQPFTYSVLMDHNRACDGEELRYRFTEENGICMSQAAAEIDCGPCSVLEMMVALAVRCEENIMRIDERGDTTGVWFNEMLNSMDVDSLTDENYSEFCAEKALNRMITRTYAPNGAGGLFTVSEPCPDMRRLEIWEQLMLFLNDYIQFTEEYPMPEIRV